MAYILVVDDDPVVRGIVRTLLENAGHEIEEARDGKEGLRNLAGRPADLVIVELYMDGMDGIEFLRESRQIGVEAPVLIMSGGGQGGTASLVAARSLGAVGSITMPCDEERLLAEVVRILNTEGQAGASPR